MEVVITRTIESLLMPPGSIGLLIVLGLALFRFRPKFAVPVIGGALFVGYLLSTKAVAYALISLVQSYPALTEDEIEGSSAQAIVVLSAGRYSDAAEYGGQDVVGDRTLLRVRYGATLHHKTGLPVLVSGGSPLIEEQVSLAQLMSDSLRDDFKVAEIWLEDKSRTTAENAINSQQLLAEKDVDTIFLVTEAWHMPRSVDIFESTGLKVIPAPTRFIAHGDDSILWLRWLPSSYAMSVTTIALHELLGLVWYKLRH